MSFIADRVFDLGLAVLDTEANRLDICSSEPATFAAATGAATLGHTTSISIGAPAARTPNGRRVTVASVSGVAVTGTGTATHWALTDTANSRLLATGSLDAPRAVTTGDTFSTAAFDIGIPGAV
jgi:hypothetical protein